jgi:prepilin-type N-terminal cleavage/methylation domain-containing protein
VGGGGAELTLRKVFSGFELTRGDEPAIGFTLAEVLITLGIIGVVAALIMPVLVVKYQEKAIVTQVKKFYNVISNAYMLAVNEHGTPEGWDLIAESNPNGAANLLNKIAPYMRLQNAEGNFGKYFQLNGGSANYNIEGASAVLADGTVMTTTIRSANCSTKRGTSPAFQSICGFALIDINGLKPPNTLGRDVFGPFYFTKYGIVLEGAVDNTYRPFVKDCLVDKIGYGCTAWLIFNENMDYLHCDNLSWDGPKKCN